MVKIIIFTDLDGTLLHPKTYSFEEARPALNLIKEKGIPLVLCSSKTRAEMEVYRKRLENEHPFVSENGGGIFIPKGYFGVRNAECGEGTVPEKIEEAVPAISSDEYETIVTGTPYQTIRKAFLELKHGLNAKVKGFGDMTEREIAALSGLTEEEAALAKQRDFGEPFFFEGEPDGRLLKAIEEEGLHWTQGRFFHIMGDNDKGRAVKILTHLYGKVSGEISTFGLGDGFNDLPMLKEVDYPVLVQKEDGSYDSRVELPNLTKAKKIGPSAWNEEVLEVLGRQVFLS